MANSCSKRPTTVTCRFMSMAPPRNRFSHCVEYNLLICGHYYAGNVAKGAVFLQLCGWMGTWELWAGAISDTEYQTRSGVFEYMQWFVDHFDKGIPFTNIVDKGVSLYRGNLASGKTDVSSTGVCKERSKVQQHSRGQSIVNSGIRSI